MSIETRTSEIVQVIVGTAGHVDHGKTTLVRLLTGCDTDRLPEEKKRKLSIDLGFAPCRLPGNRVAGIVDVPGHADFIRNMVAGAASIDVLMLLIAADDGIMPQTREHLQIVSLLRTPRVMAILSKIDLVDEVIRETVSLEIREFLDSSGFPEAPIIPFSGATGEGLVEIRRTLNRLIESIPCEPDPRAFRMNIERVFSVKGYGTVVTGIPVSGSASPGQSVVLHPAEEQYSVRAIEAYRQDMESAPPHSCAAINLRDLDPEKVERGMTITAPGTYRSTAALTASLKNITPDTAISRLMEGTLLTGTSKVRATIRLLGCETLKPGQDCYVHIRMNESVVAAAGDRYIIRSLNPPATLGGGEIISTMPSGRKKLTWSAEEMLYKGHMAVLEKNYVMAELLAGPFNGMSRSELSALTHQEDSERALQRLIEMGDLIDIGGGGYLVREKLPSITELLVRTLEIYHKKHMYSRGMDHMQFCTLLGLEPKPYPLLTETLAADERIVYSRNRYHLQGFKPDLKAHDLNLKENIYAYIAKGGVNGQVRGGIMQKFGLTDDRFRYFMRMLQEEEIVRVAGNYAFISTSFNEIREVLLTLFQQKDIVTISDFRDALQVGRHQIVDLLEAFDAERLTRRFRGGRILAARTHASAGSADVRQDPPPAGQEDML